MSYVSAYRRSENERRRKNMPPLEANAFLRWAWDGAEGSSPCTVEDVAFELHEPDTEHLRKLYVRIAARVRRNIRLGLEPWEGI